MTEVPEGEFCIIESRESVKVRESLWWLESPGTACPGEGGPGPDRPPRPAPFPACPGTELCQHAARGGAGQHCGPPQPHLPVDGGGPAPAHPGARAGESERHWGRAGTLRCSQGRQQQALSPRPGRPQTRQPSGFQRCRPSPALQPASSLAAPYLPPTRQGEGEGEALLPEGGELPEEPYPSSIPFFPPITDKTIQLYINLYLASVVTIIAFGAVLAPVLEVKLGLGGARRGGWARAGGGRTQQTGSWATEGKAGTAVRSAAARGCGRGSCSSGA